MSSTLRRKLTAIGWGSWESSPSLRSWAVALLGGALLFSLGYLVLAITPIGRFSIGEPARPENTIVEGFLTRPVELFIVLVPAALSIYILYLDRGRKDRYDPLALLAVVLGALGFATANSGLETFLFHRCDWRPLGLLILSVSSFAASAGMSLVSLAILLITNSPRRGRMFALFTLVWSAWFGGCLYVYLLRPVEPPAAMQDGIEVPGVYTTHFLTPQWDPGPYETLRIRSSGRIEWRRRVIPGGEADLDAGQIHALLVAIASNMEQREGIPEEPLYIRADRQASAGLVARVLSACRAEDVGIWKLILAVEITSVQSGLENWGAICTSLPRIVLEGGLAEPLEVPALGPEDVVEVHALEDDDGGLEPVFRYLGQERRDAGALAGLILETRRDLRSGQTWWDCRLLLRIDPRLRWEAAVDVMSEVFSRANQEQLLSGLEILEPR